MRAVELAVYADALAGEAASLSARAEAPAHASGKPRSRKGHATS